MTSISHPKRRRSTSLRTSLIYQLSTTINKTQVASTPHPKEITRYRTHVLYSITRQIIPSSNNNAAIATAKLKLSAVFVQKKQQAAAKAHLSFLPKVVPPNADNRHTHTPSVYGPRQQQEHAHTQRIRRLPCTKNKIVREKKGFTKKKKGEQREGGG